MGRPASETRASFSKLTAPQGTLVPALVGSAICWMAFPPVGWSYLAWVGPLPWIVLIGQETLPGRRPYRALWLAGFVFWLLTVHWIRLPHPMNHIAWVALAAYLGLYLPAFVALSRVGVGSWRLPMVLVAPVVWTGLEWFRGRLLTGFHMGSLAHTQVSHLPVIQIADLVGEYGVTFLIVLVAASIAQFVLTPTSPRAALYLLPAAAAVCGVLYYGHTRIAELEEREPHPGPRIVLIQGNTLADWKSDPEKQQQIMDDHVRLSREAVRDYPDIDLVIWPETAFRETLITVEQGFTPPPDRVSPEKLTAAQQYLKLLTSELGTAVLVGIDRVHLFPDATGQLDYRTYNSSVLVDSSGDIIGTYDKMHRVPFGEYIPLAGWFPVLYRLTPLTGGIDAGIMSNLQELEMNDFHFAVNICYESAVPHLIRRQVLQHEYRLSAPPDVLVNLTNDAWYWGSSELDMHLACGVFRAVEMRVPLVIAANGGLSAHVDLLGRLVQVSPRQQTATLVVDLERSNVLSLYLWFGDWFAIGCVICCVAVAVCGGKILSKSPRRYGRERQGSLE